MKFLNHEMAVFVCGYLVVASVSNGFADPIATSASQPQALQQSPEQLKQLVAPIALYPDPLVGQILAAATYPTELEEAEQWLQQHQGLTSDALAKEVDKQSWDPSVKALTQFPSILGNMSQNLAWTSELGDAYVNQRQELTQAIQNMRHLAMNAGNLRSTSQENVATEGDTISVQSTSTDEVYVPQYDPWLVYGDPLPAFYDWSPYPGLYLDGSGIDFGLGFGIGLFAGYAWSWNHWGCDWHGGGVVYNHQTFVSHSRSIVNRNDLHSAVSNFHSDRMNASHVSHVNGRRFAGHAAPHTTGGLHAEAARHFSAYNRFHSRGSSGAHAYFHSGGFHGGSSHGGGFQVVAPTVEGAIAEAGMEGTGGRVVRQLAVYDPPVPQEGFDIAHSGTTKTSSLVIARPSNIRSFWKEGELLQFFAPLQEMDSIYEHITYYEESVGRRS